MPGPLVRGGRSLDSNRSNGSVIIARIAPSQAHPPRCERESRCWTPSSGADYALARTVGLHPMCAMRRRSRCVTVGASRDRGGRAMAIGPVQLIVLGFEHPEFHGEIIAELERLKGSDTVRVIDALAVHKDAEGEIEVMHLSNLSKDEAVELGSKVGALVGLGIEGEEGMYAGAEAGAEAAADGLSAFSDEEAWDVIQEIPNDSGAALILLEHHWAVPLRNAIARAHGFRISDGFVSPPHLVEIGLLSSEEAQELHRAETARQTA